jgi:hypothetical protein
LIHRLPDGFSEVFRGWEGSDCALVASGPSLSRPQCEYVKGNAKVIAVNDGYKFAPWADILYAADHRWWTWEKRDFAGLKVSIEQHQNVEWPADIHVLRNLDNGSPTGISLDPKGLKTGANSGYQALNLAVLLGAKRIILLGYDYKFSQGKSHFFGDHPVSTNENHLSLFVKNFSTIENELKRLGVEVLNCSPESVLNQFPKVSLESVEFNQTASAVSA